MALVDGGACKSPTGVTTIGWLEEADAIELDETDLGSDMMSWAALPERLVRIEGNVGMGDSSNR